MKLMHFGSLIVMLIAFQSHALAEYRIALFAGANYSSADTVRVPLQIDSTLDTTFSGAGVRVGLNMEVNEWLDMEGGWVKFGSDTGVVTFIDVCVVPAPGSSTCPVSVHEFKQRGSAYWLGFTPKLQRGELEIFVKLGAVRASAETTSILDHDIRGRESDTNFLVGAGVAHPLTDVLGLRLDFERFGELAYSFGISVEYRF